jgi:ABC-type multidrug transport system fused ATPase/permease subunit
VSNAIRFGRDEITDEHVRVAAQNAHIAEEIEARPDGYDTQVGQLGEAVSGSQPHLSLRDEETDGSLLTP